MNLRDKYAAIGIVSITAYIFPFRKDNNIIYERNKHMNIPANLIKKNYENFLKL